MNDGTQTRDVQGLLDALPMRRPQVAAILVTTVLSALDGYDVLSVTFAAPAISRDWGIGRAALGIVLSSGLVGMAIGSLLLAPLADVYGRRRAVLFGLTLMAVGSFLSAFAGTVPALAAWRIVTGLGIGVMVAVIMPLAAEFANARWRPFAVSAMAIGYPVGGTMGALTAAALLRTASWPSVFLTGALAALLLIPAVLRLLPESPSFLLTRRRPDSLARLNDLLARCGHAPLTSLPPACPAGGASYCALLAPGRRARTLHITLVNLLYVVAVYYVLSWLPQLVADLGYTPSGASMVSAVFNLAGVVGGLALGWAATRTRPIRLAAGAMVGLGLTTAAFGAARGPSVFLPVAAAVLGFFMIAGISGLYATISTSFTIAARASGAGFVIGVGRLGSAAAPTVAGWMFAAGLTRGEVSGAFAISAGLAGLLLAFGPPATTAERAISWKHADD